MSKHQIQLFATGFLHVCAVALSTYYIAHRVYLGVFVMGIAVSWLWTSNVKKVAISGKADRIIYALGAAIGSVSGTLLTTML